MTMLKHVNVSTRTSDFFQIFFFSNVKFCVRPMLLRSSDVIIIFENWSASYCIHVKKNNLPQLTGISSNPVLQCFELISIIPLSDQVARSPPGRSSPSTMEPETTTTCLSPSRYSYGDKPGNMENKSLTGSCWPPTQRGRTCICT